MELPQNILLRSECGLINHVKLYPSKEYLKEFGTPQQPEDLDHHRLIAFGHPLGLSGFHGMNWHLPLGAKAGTKDYGTLDLSPKLL